MGQVPHWIPFIHWYAIEIIQSNPAVFNIQLPIAQYLSGCSNAYILGEGNLPSEKVTKRDIFRIFSRHGRLAQISIKQAYGFVQFLDVSSCVSALRDEQGASCKGRKMRKSTMKPHVTQMN